MDGTLANPQNDDVAAVVPSAKDGHCRPVVFVVPKEYHAAHKDDAWRVYLLDTRRAGGVPAGTGFWYVRRSSGDVKLKWADPFNNEEGE